MVLLKKLNTNKNQNLFIFVKKNNHSILPLYVKYFKMITFKIKNRNSPDLETVSIDKALSKIPKMIKSYGNDRTKEAVIVSYFYSKNRSMTQYFVEEILKHDTVVTYEQKKAETFLIKCQYFDIPLVAKEIENHLEKINHIAQNYECSFANWTINTY